MNNTNLNFFFVFLFVLNICSAQKGNAIKTFDIETFNKNKNHLNNYSYKDNNDFIIKQSDDNYEYYETVKHKDSFFQTINRYYKSGRLKMTVKDFPNNFLAGIKKEYNEQGKLIKETDYDAPYKFTWEDVLEFIKEHKIDMNHEQFLVNRSFGYGKSNIGNESEKPFWAITYDISNKYKLKVLIIDGLTGKLIDNYEEDYPADGEYDETLPDMENE